MAAIPFDATQYIVTEDSLVSGETIIPTTIELGENYIGVFTFSPGFSGKINSLSVRGTVSWTNPKRWNLNGNIDIKARKYGETEWVVLDTAEFNGTSAASGTETFDILLISGETSLLQNLDTVPIIIAASVTAIDENDTILSGESLLE